MSAASIRPSKPGTILELTKIGVAVALTMTAGYVDAMGWLALDRVFTAQMSGNFLLLAVHIVADEKGHVSLQAVAILAFFMGLVISGSVIEIGMRRHLRRIFVAAMIGEFVLLLGFAAAGGALLPAGSAERAHVGWPTYALTAIVALAMGAQNTSLRMSGILSVYTTHVTGTLTGLSEELIVCGFSLLQPEKPRGTRGDFAAASLQQKHPVTFKNIGQSAALLGAFFFGAVAGAAALEAAGIAIAMCAPLALVLAIIVLDWRLPLTDFPSSVEQE